MRYTKKQIQDIICALKECGNGAQVARELGVSPKTVYKIMDGCTEFKALQRKAIPSDKLIKIITELKKTKNAAATAQELDLCRQTVSGIARKNNIHLSNRRNNTKLSHQDWQKIERCVEQGETITNIAMLFHVTRQTINRTRKKYNSTLSCG